MSEEARLERIEKKLDEVGQAIVALAVGAVRCVRGRVHQD
jgi:hypothetical protein